MTDEWDDYNVRDEPAPRPTRTETVIQAATERVVKAPNVRARALKYGPTTLLGSRGFRALRSQAQNLEWTNDPSRDLDRLMAVYRDWAHRMYPKFVFRDFVDKTEKQCRTQSMKVGRQDD
jgi:hypothetical protein